MWFCGFRKKIRFHQNCVLNGNVMYYLYSKNIPICQNYNCSINNIVRLNLYSDKAKKIEITGRQPITARTMTTARPRYKISRYLYLL